MQKSKRIQTARETLKILENGFYVNRVGEKIHIQRQQKAAERNTKVYTPDELEALIQTIQLTPQEHDTQFEVNGLTTLDSVRQEYKEGGKLLCLNFASARNPGGGFQKGSQAQEESIARATGLYPCLLAGKVYYDANRAIRTCLYTDHMIYSPNVPVIKDEEGESMDQPVYASVITAPAVNTGVILRNELEKKALIEPRMLKRIDMVLAICAQLGYETLILGAWGCGVFRNDPNVIARMFHELLAGKYKRVFKRIVFSVYAKDERFIRPFKELFGEN